MTDEPAAGLSEHVDPGEAVRANRHWWDREAEPYQAEHARFLAGLRGPARPADSGGSTPGHPADLPARLVWSPEGLDEADAGLLGPVAALSGATVLEVGAGAAQGSRWVAAQGADVVALDLSVGMLAMARGEVPVVQADAARLPLADRSVDAAFSAFGALPFVPDATAVLVDVSRVLRPEGGFVFSVTHPFRWALPDDPGWDGLRVSMSYFDRRPYVEHGPDGRLDYAEYHRTVGDWVRAVRAAGLRLDDVVEPEWPEDLQDVWGGWSPLRGQYVPGTAVFCTRRA